MTNKGTETFMEVFKKIYFKLINTKKAKHTTGTMYYPLGTIDGFYKYRPANQVCRAEERGGLRSEIEEGEVEEVGWFSLRLT